MGLAVGSAIGGAHGSPGAPGHHVHPLHHLCSCLCLLLPCPTPPPLLLPSSPLPCPLSTLPSLQMSWAKNGEFGILEGPQLRWCTRPSCSPSRQEACTRGTWAISGAGCARWGPDYPAEEDHPRGGSGEGSPVAAEVAKLTEVCPQRQDEASYQQKLVVMLLGKGKRGCQAD